MGISAHDKDGAASELQDALGASARDLSGFDRALRHWLEAYAAAAMGEARGPMPGSGTSGADVALAATLQGRPNTSLLYAWARLWKLHDELRLAYGLPSIGRRLRLHIARAMPALPFPAGALFAFTVYFQEAPQDSRIASELWNVYRRSGAFGPRDSALRDEAFAFFLRLMTRRFPNGYERLAAILTGTREGDVRTRAALEKFATEESRNSARFAAVVLHMLASGAETPLTRDQAARTLLWFSGPPPARSPELDERTRALETELGIYNLRFLAHWIRERPGHGWTVNPPPPERLFRRLWATASVYLGYSPRLRSRGIFRRLTRFALPGVLKG